LGGIYTALITSHVDAELFLACDMPFIDLPLLETICQRYLKTGQPVFTRCGQVVGFPLLIPSGAVAEIKQQINQKTFSLQSLAIHLRAAFVEVPPTGSIKLLNINTPAEFEKAAALSSNGRVKIFRTPAG